MSRTDLTVSQLEDRTTPVSLKFSTRLTLSAVSTPPQDPMDNPPPSQPGGTTTPTVPPPVSPPPPPTFSVFKTN